MFTLEEKQQLIEFLDRVPMTGHQERHSMNNIVQKLVTPPQPVSQEDKTNVVSN